MLFNNHPTGKALASIPTACEIVEEDGIPYQLRRLLGSHPKGEARREQRRTGRNPFLPPEPDLLVGDITETHRGVLNKFNVFGGHLLLVTREYALQDEGLDGSDFEALALAMAGIDGLGFFNGGRVAGASQPHKHLQLVPLPLAPQGPPIPIEALRISGANSAAGPSSGVIQVPTANSTTTTPMAWPSTTIPTRQAWTTARCGTMGCRWSHPT